MSLNQDDVTRIARLARLELDEAKKTQTLAELNSILGLIEKLQSVDTSGIEPLSHPLGARQEMVLRLREDHVTEPANEQTRAANMKNAPAQENGLFLVPKVIE